MSVNLDHIDVCYSSAVPSLRGTADTEQLYVTIRGLFGPLTVQIFTGTITALEQEDGRYHFDLQCFSGLIRSAFAQEMIRSWDAVFGTVSVNVREYADHTIKDAGKAEISFHVFSARTRTISDRQGLPIEPKKNYYRALIDSDVITIPMEYRGDIGLPIFIMPGLDHDFSAQVVISYFESDGSPKSKVIALPGSLFNHDSIPVLLPDSTDIPDSPYPVKISIQDVYDRFPASVKAVHISYFDLVITHKVRDIDDLVNVRFEEQILIRSRAMYNPACISYRSRSGAPSDLWISVTKDTETEHKGDLATVGGTLVAYNRTSESRISISSYIPANAAVSAQSAVETIYAFNGVDVVADDCKTDLQQDGSLKFTAKLRRADRAPWI